MRVSVIIPCFNEQEAIRESCSRLAAVLVDDSRFQFEFIFIDDGSRDGTRAILEEVARTDRRMKVIVFARNFGHQPAVSAGIKWCQGDLAVIIDADLQDPPEVVPGMIELLTTSGSNVVYGVRRKRQGETLFKRVTAKLFYLFLNSLSEYPLPLDAGDFRVIDRKVLDAFNTLPENNKYIRGLVSWIGFKQTPFYYERHPRFAGSTKYSLKRMIQFAATGIFYFSKKPLRLATTTGFISVMIGMLLFVWVLYNKLASPEYLISGWTSVVLLIIFFGGVQLLTIGILGHYIGSLFDEVKKRPEYIIDRTTNLDLTPPRP